MQKCVILANGDFPTSPEPLKILSEATFVCCCDGAAEKLICYGRTPDAIVGDGDSLSAELKEEYCDIIHSESEQDYNDLTKAVRYCISQGAKEIIILGATGLREDHTLGNISLLAYYKETYAISISMYTDFGVFLTAGAGTTRFSSFPRQQISIFNLNCSKIESEGLKWKTQAFKQFWQGTLNEALGNSFCITADNNYLVYSTYKAKE